MYKEKLMQFFNTLLLIAYYVTWVIAFILWVLTIGIYPLLSFEAGIILFGSYSVVSYATDHKLLRSLIK